MRAPAIPSRNALLLIVAGAKGAIGTTLAAAAAALKTKPEIVLHSLTTADKFPFLAPADAVHMTGWDIDEAEIIPAIEKHGVLPPSIWQAAVDQLAAVQIRRAPAPSGKLGARVEMLQRDIEDFKGRYPEALPVFVNLLPANTEPQMPEDGEARRLLNATDSTAATDLAYTLAAVLSGVPVVNFTPNRVELPAVIREAETRGIPLCGRDGKTGQTYLKVVLASAFKARNLTVDGWYSLNILGNADGRNLMDPQRACGKLDNKTRLLDAILGYRVGDAYDAPAHKVHIDYYPPRGDAKEAWDVIDFHGLFGLPMSLRLNMLGRDSILAAPLVLDLARWMAALQTAGRGGTTPELGFFFKKPVGENPALTFQDQLLQLIRLEQACARQVCPTRTG